MANEIWTIKRCLEWTKEYLAERGEEHPRLSAEWLLCAATGLARIDLYMRMDEMLDATQLETMHAAVVRRAKGEPLQYITGSTQFRMIDVACAPGVLIPRPETEMLVEEVLNYLDAEVLSPEAATRQRAELPWNDEVEQARKAEAALADERATAERRAENLTAADEAALGGDVLGSRAYAEELADREAEEAAAQAEEAEAAEAEELAEPELDEYGIAIEGADQETTPAQDAAVDAADPRVARVLEVGCGTGCISLSLAWERRGHVTCTATDIEPRAIDLATKNRDALGLTSDEVAFSLTNLVSSIPREEWGTFDVLVSNPPYIPTDVMRSLPHEVKDFEPDLALEGGADGLDIFRRLLNAAPYMLRAGGLFACELYEGALDAAAELCRQAGLSDVRIVRDLTDRPRIVRAIVTEPKQRQ
ncbi:HemK/PrmC family methyltransferase [Collinsella sp. AM13-34]|uniref:N5-glutamine methyltransferase family protein n=1 Tax=Collinsella sp. AM13-34 TaxID=2292024 RepID=UPI000E466659|nr:HemK/PrmC family methyltransferase [Collinsella sp. AM13-34]RHI85245.1 peptide chain release factor N(5)-glutamine methyltransferase [Collinsella sp. AM13-34]